MSKTCILILGMHRSGTSALSGTLNRLGVDLGSDLIKPMKHNEKGFYENILLYKANEKLLKEMKSSWDDVFYNESKLNSIQDISELENIIEKEFKNSELFAIKDPRLAYLLPIYIKALTNQGIAIKIIIPLRNPSEVAASLTARNQFSREKGLLLWAYHFLLSEKHSRGLPRVFTRFDELLHSPRKVLELIDQKLCLDLSLRYDQIEHVICDFLTPELKHHNMEFDDSLGNVPKLIRDIAVLIPDLNNYDSTGKLDSLRNQLFDNQNLFYNTDITKLSFELFKAKQQLREICN